MFGIATTLSLLLGKRAGMAPLDEFEQTILRFAAEYRNAEVICLLLQTNVNPNFKSLNEQAAFAVTLDSGSPEVARILPKAGYAALNVSYNGRDKEKARLLLGLDLPSSEATGLLRGVVDDGDIELTRFLLDTNAVHLNDTEEFDDGGTIRTSRFQIKTRT